MTKPPKNPPVSIGFEEASLSIPLAAILPLRKISDQVKKSVKYAQIKASIEEVGIIEPPVVARNKTSKDMFTLLDGHLRIEVLRDRGDENVVCLVSTDDEAFTYNSRVSRIATIQEHKMILNAIRNGVPEERLAKALNINIANIRRRRNLLIGICPEAAELLKDKHVPMEVFNQLRYLKPVRQIEAAELMTAMNNYSTSYARSIVAATQSALLAKDRPKRKSRLSKDQIALMQRESLNLDKEFRAVEKSYGSDHLDLTMASGYIERLLGNARIVGFLAMNHPDILAQFQNSVEVQVDQEPQ